MNETKNGVHSRNIPKLIMRESAGGTTHVASRGFRLNCRRPPFFKYVVTFVELVIDLTIYSPIRDRQNQYMIVLSGSGQVKNKTTYKKVTCNCSKLRDCFKSRTSKFYNKFSKKNFVDL